MSIKPKTGKCIDCGPDSHDQPLISKRCRNHYWQYRATLKKHTVVKQNKYERSRKLGVYFADQVQQMPRYCENCNDYLNPYAPWGARSYVAHIVPKRYFESVMLHPLNRWFGCVQCHTNYDNWSGDKLMQMPVMQKVFRRFDEFKNDIDPDELKHLPEHFRSLYD